MDHYSITYTELSEHLESNHEGVSKIIDVRQARDFRRHTLEGAVNIPLEELSQHIQALKSPSLIVLFCNGGGKSKRGVKMLREKGLENVYYLEGGIKGTRKQT